MSFVKDPCGIVCVIVTYLAIFYADYVVTRWIVLQTMSNSLWGPINVVVFNSIVFLLTLSHLKAVFCDPGSVPLPQMRLDFSDLHSAQQQRYNDDEDWTVCTRCETYRPPRAHHCRICKRCIRRMDHHCPWINNCVGERNQKYFLQFLVYVCILSVYSVTLVISSWIYPCVDEHCRTNLHDAQARMLHSILLLLESTLFGLFVIAIMVDQLHAIFYDEPPIDLLQHRGAFKTKNLKLLLLADVCGRTHPLFWLFPCTEARRYDTPLIDYDV